MSDPRESAESALERIVSTPQLAQAVSRLPAELLHRVIEQHGLEDSAELVALATPEQLARVFDLDLWRPAQAGLDDAFDARRFGVWLHVLLEAGAAVAAGKIAEMPPGMVVAGLTHHVRVFDAVTAMPYTTLDGQRVSAPTEGDAMTCDISGYRIVALREDAWDAVTEVLGALATEYAGSFHALMARCRALSNSAPEASGMHELLDDREQSMFDLASDRERRRELHGYASPAQARAFLDLARRPATAGAPDPIAVAYFRAIEEQAQEQLQSRAALSAGSATGDGMTAAEATGDEEAVAAVVEALVESGILEPARQALPAGSEYDEPRLARIHRALGVVLDRDPDLYALRSGELGYLANTLVSGCSIQARAFTPQEASDAAAAVCNLGLENWPDAPDDLLVEHDCVDVFRRGWCVLYERVSLPVARSLRAALARVRGQERETQIGVNKLRVELKRHLAAGTPWRVRAALEALATLDLVAWAALLGLLDECPVLPAALGASRGTKPHTVSATAFEFISENAQLDAIDEFLVSLPDQLQS